MASAREVWREWECAERASVLVSAGSPKEVECGRDEEEEEGQWRRRRGVCAPVPPVSECHLCTLMLWRSVGRGRDGSGRMRLVCTARLHPFALCGGRGGNRGGGGVESECPGGRNVCMALGACWWGVRRDKGEGASAVSLSECSASGMACHMHACAPADEIVHRSVDVSSRVLVWSAVRGSLCV